MLLTAPERQQLLDHQIDPETVVGLSTTASRLEFRGRTPDGSMVLSALVVLPPKALSLVEPSRLVTGGGQAVPQIEPGMEMLVTLPEVRLLVKRERIGGEFLAQLLRLSLTTPTPEPLDPFASAMQALREIAPHIAAWRELLARTDRTEADASGEEADRSPDRSGYVDHEIAAFDAAMALVHKAISAIPSAP